LIQRNRPNGPDAYLGQCVPTLPEIGIGNDADGFAELGLYCGWGRDHQTDELFLDCLHLIEGKLVVALFVLRRCQIPASSSVYTVVERTT
jgi:hypothetical protein